MNKELSIGFTGTRYGMTPRQRETLKLYLKRNPIQTSYHHGDCIGSDEEFHNILELLGHKLNIIIHPPKNDSKRAFCKGGIILEPKPYLERNKDIVDESDILLATPAENNEQIRSGTWSTIRYGHKRKKQVFIIYPNGVMKLYE